MNKSGDKMSYITSNLSPYRGDTSKEFFEILSDDYEWLCSSLKERGFIFFIAFITIMSLSLLKAIAHVIIQSQKPKMTYKHLELHRGIRHESITDILTRREAIDEVKNHDNLCPNDKVKTQRANTIIALRNYLYQHNLTLHAHFIKRVNHKVTDEELLEMYRRAELFKPLSTTHVTFGEEVNKLLKEVLKNKISLGTNRFTKETYIRVNDDDYEPLKKELFNLYNENIKILFD